MGAIVRGGHATLVLERNEVWLKFLLFRLGNKSRASCLNPRKQLDLCAMKKKHTYNWLICLGLFMPKPMLS